VVLSLPARDDGGAARVGRAARSGSTRDSGDLTPLVLDPFPSLMTPPPIGTLFSEALMLIRHVPSMTFGEILAIRALLALVPGVVIVVIRIEDAQCDIRVHARFSRGCAGYADDRRRKRSSYEHG